MGIFTVIFLSFASVAFFYFAFRACLKAFAKRELDICEDSHISGNTLEIYARAENLEYLLRMSKAIPGLKTTVYIDKNRDDAEECAYIASVFSRDTDLLEIYHTYF